MDDAELIRHYARDGDHAAFAELVRRHVGMVYAAALRRLGGDAHAAADVTQQVFTALARQARTLARDVTLPAWLYNTTRNIAVDFVRAEQRRRRREQEASIMSASASDNKSATADWESIRPTLDAAMDELGARDREAVVLRFFAKRSFGEIGAALRVTEDAARMRVERALEKLRLLLARRGVTSTSAALGIVLANEAACAVPVGLAASVAGAAVASASGVAAVGAVAGIVHFMSTSKIAASAAVLVLIGGGGIAGYEWRSSQHEKAELAAERREVVALAQRTEEAERRAGEMRATVARAQQATAPTVQTSVSALVEDEGNGPFGPYPAGSRARGRALMAAYPEVQRLLIEDRRAFFASMYEKFYEKLGLTEAEAEAFELIKIAGVGTHINLSDLPGIGRVTLDPLPALPPEEKEARLRQLLGERGYERLQEFDRSPRDSRAAELASRLYFTDAPLTAEQGARFLETLAACNQAGRDQTPAQYWSAVRERAGTFLSAPQLAALSGFEASAEYSLARAQNQKLRQAASREATK
jgi:RNA polymerase sigma factor (sigma-70 family)